MRTSTCPSASKALRHSPLVAALALALAPLGAAAATKTFTASSESTLRQAISDVNAQCTANDVSEIVIAAPFVALPSSPFPTLTCPATVINPTDVPIEIRGDGYFNFGCVMSSTALTTMRSVSFTNFSYGGSITAVCGTFNITGGTFNGNATAVSLTDGKISGASFGNLPTGNLNSIVLSGTAEAQNNEIANLSGGTGIQLYDSAKAKANVIQGGAYGIRMTGTTTADGNQIQGADEGISTFSYGGMAILNNAIDAAGFAGIYAYNASLISGNIVSGSGTGISTQGNTTISNNVVKDNIGTGISAFFGGAVQGNQVSGNAVGIEVYESSVTNNVVGTIAGTNPNGVGIKDVMNDGIPSGGGYAISNNLIGGNNIAGIFLDSNDNIVAGNKIGFLSTAGGASAASVNHYGIHLGINAYGYQVLSNVIGNSEIAGIYAEDAVDLDIGSNLIGTSTGGSAAVPNGIGIQIRCGTLVDIFSNTISGNTNQGVVLLGVQGGRSANSFASNYIGTQAFATATFPPALPNGGAGVVLSADSACMLGDQPKSMRNAGKAQRRSLAADIAKALVPKSGNSFETNDVGIVGNVIGHNGGAGIRADAGVGNFWYLNRIANNGGKNIDLNAGAPLPNDALDVDTGPNLRQNAPEILAVQQNANNTTTVTYKLAMEPADPQCPAIPPSFGYTYRIDFFANPAAGVPAGATPLANTLLPGAPCGGDVAATFVLSGLQDFISATARNESTFNSSEFSNVMAAVAAPAVTVAPASASFGPTPIGTTATRTLTFTSVGGQPWRFGSFSTDATCGRQLALSKALVAACSAPFSCDSDCTSGSDYASGQTCTLTATYTPSALTTQSQTIYLCDNAHASGLAISLDGSGTPTQAVTVTPTAWDFGSVRVGQTASLKQFSVLNTNATAMAINTINVTSPFVTSSTTCPLAPATLAPGGACEVLVGFTPTAAVTSSGTLTIVSGTANYSNAVATLTGTGTQVAQISLPTNIDFGAYTVGTTPAVRTVDITNSGNADVVFSSITSTAQFTLTNGCGATLAPGATCTLTLTFGPTATGTYTGTLAVASNALGSGNVALSGTAIAAPVPAATFSATTLDLGGTALGTTTAPGSITITSSGTAPYVVSRYATDSACSSTASICGSGEFLCSLGCNPGASYSPGASCTISARFSPVTLGVKTVSFYVCDNTSVSPRKITLQGEGINPTVVDVAPSTFSFGTVQLGQTSAAQTFTLVNSSGQAVTVQPPVTTGSFRITASNCPSSLGQGQRCTVDVVFVPTIAGNASGQLIMQAAVGSARSSAIASLTGIGGTQPVLTLPQGVDFGSAVVASAPVVRTVTLGNSGNSPLSITSVTLSGAAFALVNECGASVQPGGSCSLVLTFAPAQAGEFTGTITVVTNAVGGPRTVQLIARAQPQPVPVVRVTPAAMGFGDRQIGSQSASQRVTVNNVGGAPAAIGSIQVPPDYVVTLNGCGVSVAAQQTCFIEVALRPVTAGPRAGVLSISTNADGSPHTVNLSGTGCRPYTPGTRNDSRNAACGP